MTQREAREIIMKETRAAMFDFRTAHGLPLNMHEYKGDDLDEILDRQREYINARLAETLPEDVRRAAV
jgi:hypothetical protein